MARVEQERVQQRAQILAQDRGRRRACAGTGAARARRGAGTRRPGARPSIGSGAIHRSRGDSPPRPRRGSHDALARPPVRKPWARSVPISRRAHAATDSGSAGAGGGGADRDWPAAVQQIPPRPAAPADSSSARPQQPPQQWPRLSADLSGRRGQRCVIGGGRGPRRASSWPLGAREADGAVDGRCGRAGCAGGGCDPPLSAVPAPAARGQLAIEAVPWAAVASIEGEDGNTCGGAHRRLDAVCH